MALPAHAAIETYSVLTRLPEPPRLPPAGVLRYLRVSFAGELLTLSADAHRRLLEQASSEPMSYFVP